VNPVGEATGRDATGVLLSSEGLTRALPSSGTLGTMYARLLLAEDDRAVRESLVRALELEGYSVVAVNDGAAALDAVRLDPPDLILLDVMMPVLDGLTACRVLRSERSRVPILMLTARTETGDRVAGLDAGADDYLAKPFALDELLARIRALLRRSQDVEEDQPSAWRLADLRVDGAARQAWRGGRPLELSKTEFDLLELLVRNAGIVLDHTTIYERIWGYDFGPDSKNLAVYIGYLRRKTEEHGEPRLIQTVRGVGYTAREGP
jgi:two-component system, OmpR family, response regulator MprA